MPKRNLIWILAIVIAAMVTVYATRTPPPISPSAQEDLRPVIQSYYLIKNSYHGQIDEEALCRGAVRGMIESLDKYSTYIPPGKVDWFMDRTVVGKDRGLGLRLESFEGAVTVLGALAGSPAFAADICTGDRVAMVDGCDIAGKSVPEIQRLLDGKESAVALTLLRTDGKTEVVHLKRGEFPVESIQGLYRDREGQWVFIVDPSENIAYVHIKEFVQGTAEQLQQTLRQLPEPRGLILDLRDNPGGLLASAVDVANMFVKEGVIVTSIDRFGKRQVYSARGEGKAPSVPMVVLVNENTASAAEIVAGAMWIHGRAVLVGRRTLGKGCVQSMLHLPEGLGQVNLTTAEYVLDGDEPIARRPGSQAWGVAPHEQVLIPEADQEQLNRMRLAAEVVVRNRTPATAPSRPTRGPAVPLRLLRLDAQLARGVELLTTPAEMQTILKQAAESRAARKKAQAASESSKP